MTRNIFITAFLALSLLPLISENTESIDEERIIALEERISTLEEELAEVRETPHIQEPTITGESRIDWEFGIESGGTGFTNENDIIINIPFLTGTESNRYGKGIRTQVSIYKFNIAADITPEGPGFTFNEGQIEAKIMWDRYYLITSNNPDYLLDYASPVGDTNWNVRTNTVASTGGLLFGIEDRGSRFEFKLGSLGDGVHNPYNDYACGFDFSRSIIRNLLNLKGGASYGLTLGDIREQGVGFTSRDLGFSVQPEIMLKDVLHGWKGIAALDMALPFDGIEYTDFIYDLMVKSELKISKMGVNRDGYDDWSMFNTTLYALPADMILDVDFQLTEITGDHGLLPLVGFDIHFSLLNLLGNADVADGRLAYKTNGVVVLGLGRVEPFLDFAYGSSNSDLAGKLSLGAGSEVVLVEDEMENPKWIIKVQYRSTDLNHAPSATQGDMGVFKVVSTLKF